MIRKLQKRFILITVLALTVAMMLVVGIVNVANLLSVRAELSGTVHMLAGMGVPGDLPQMLSERRDRWDDDDDREDDRDDRPEGTVPPGLRTRHDRNMVLESNWFVVHLDGNNAVRSVSRLSASDLTEEEAVSLAERALAEPKIEFLADRDFGFFVYTSPSDWTPDEIVLFEGIVRE